MRGDVIARLGFRVEQSANSLLFFVVCHEDSRTAKHAKRAKFFEIFFAAFAIFAVNMIYGFNAINKANVPFISTSSF